ncbi:MAG: DUF5674 family protein [Candidatus Shapirobacteria bacterium]|jgi:hypothetical protein
MSILKIDHIPSPEDVIALTQEFPEYIKLSADLNKQILYGGSRLHHDCEQKLINQESSENKHIWSRGVNLATKKIDYEAVANIKPSMGNPSSEILDPEKRRKFKDLVKIYFPDYE